MNLKSVALISLFLISGFLNAQIRSFKHFGIDKNIFPSRIECIDQNASGELLVGTLAGLVVYDGYQFKLWSVTDGLIENAISSIHTKDNLAWLGHWSGNISVINFTDQTTTTYNLQSQLGFSSITSIVSENADVAWLSTKNGNLYRLRAGQVEQVAVKSQINKLVSLNNQIYALGNQVILKQERSDSNIVWKPLVVSENESFTTICMLDEQGFLLGSDKGISRLDNNKLYHIKEDISVVSVAEHDEHVWFATSQNGLVELSLPNFEIATLKRTNGLSYNQLKDVFVDREGILWVGTLAGLDQYLGESFELHKVSDTNSVSIVWDVKRQNENLLLASSAGVYYRNPSEPKWRKSFTSQKAWKKVLQHSSGIFWLIDDLGALSYSEGEVIKKYDKITENVRCLAQVDGQIWAGTDNGLYVIAASGNLVEKYSSVNGLGGDIVNGIYPNPKRNETWITVLGGAVTVLKEGTFKQFSSESGITSKVFQDAAFDAEGNIWLASYDQGVFYQKGDQFERISTADGLTSNSIFALQIDASGNLWLGHNWGLDRYRPEFGDFEFFGSDKGFMGIEVNPGAMEIDDSGTIWIGTLSGLLAFNPESFTPNMEEPTLNIVYANLGATSVTQGEVAETQENDFRLSFKAISLMNPAENKVKYRLSGIHENWKTSKSNEPIEYFSLPPGFYSFEIVACNNHNQCSAEPIKLNFIVTPPFYRTWWFYTLLFFLAILIIYFMDRYRAVSLLEEKNKLSEKLESSKQEIIELTQEVSEFRVNKNQDSKILTKMLPDMEVMKTALSGPFKNLGIESIQKEAISSVQIIRIEHTEYKLYAMIDLLIPGQSAMYLAERIKADFLVATHAMVVSLPEEIINSFKYVVDEVVGKIHNHTGPSWLVCLNYNGKKYYHQQKTSIFFKDLDTVLELKAVELAKNESVQAHHLVEFDFPKQLVSMNAATFELLSADGSKNYQQSMVIQILNSCIDDGKEEIIKQLKESLEQWKGNSIELQQDVMLITWEHE